MSVQETRNLQNQEVKLEDILKSIRGLIDEKDKKVQDNKKLETETQVTKQQDEETVLELTNVINFPDFIAAEEKKHDQLLSDRAKLKSLDIINDFADMVKKESYLAPESQGELISKLVITEMKPMIKEWLDNNLPKLVRKIITKEIRQLVPKK